MSAEKKLEILRSVEGSGVPVTDALAKMDIYPSTYYRWRRRFRTGGRASLHDRKPHRERNWNQLLPEERAKVLNLALPTASYLMTLSGIFRLFISGPFILSSTVPVSPRTIIGIKQNNSSMEWIPVTDRLPPIGKRVLACSWMNVNYFVAYVSPL